MEMVSEEECRKFHRVVTEFYIAQDAWIGELTRKAGPGTTILILSDHGFKSGARRPEGLLPFTMDQPVEWHREDGGIFLLSGPGAARARLSEPVTLFDIAPTILALLGLPVASDMPGRVLEGALEPGFLSRFPPEKVATYEGVGSPRRAEEAPASDEVSAEMMAQLRALGYVGGDSHATGTSSRGGEGTQAPESAPAEDTPVTYHRNLATYFLGRREYAKAIEELQEANRREKLPKTYAMLAESLDALGRKREAMSALEEGWKQVPEGMEPDSILWYVQLAVDAGDPARGETYLEEHREALRNSPAIRDAARGRLAEARGERHAAEQLYERALQADPTLVGAARQLVGFYREEGRLDAIRPILEAGLRKSERIDEYHNLLGALDSSAGEKERALAHFRRAAELNPRDPRFSLNLGLTLMDLGRFDESGRVFEKALSEMPDADLYLGLGNVRLKSREPALALAAFQKAREAGGTAAPRADLGIALSYLGLRRADDALAFARESLSRNPDNPPLQNLVRDLSRNR